MKNKVYVITPYSQRALYLAESIRKDRESDAAQIIILCKSEPDKSTVLYRKAETLSLSIIKAETENTDAYLEREENTEAVFFLIDECTETNCLELLSLSEKCTETDRIYVEAEGMASELLIDSLCLNKGLHVRRIVKERSLIYRTLLENSLFDKAREVDAERVITVVIAGLDEFGMEMLKACIWCGQMDGYVLRIHVIDENTDAADRFYYDAPEIEMRNGLPRAGEDYYEIYFHSGVKMGTADFVHVLERIESPSWIFVSGKDDMTSLESAIKCREVFARQILEDDYMPLHYTDSEQIPFIQAVIRSNEVADILNSNELSNYRGQKYGIKAIGSEESLWELENVCNTMLEKMALGMHLRWGDAESFETHEYNRRASMATAIHKKYRDEKYPNDDVMKDILEHRRWNAYMRSTEGYRFGLIRDDLAKQHPSLVKYNDLSRVEKNKDKAMNQKE